MKSYVFLTIYSLKEKTHGNSRVRYYGFIKVQREMVKSFQPCLFKLLNFKFENSRVLFFLNTRALKKTLVN